MIDAPTEKFNNYYQRTERPSIDSVVVKQLDLEYKALRFVEKYMSVFDECHSFAVGTLHVLTDYLYILFQGSMRVLQRKASL